MEISKIQFVYMAELVTEFRCARLCYTLNERGARETRKRELDRLHTEIQKTLPIEFDAIACSDMFHDEDTLYLHWFVQNMDKYYGNKETLEASEIARIICENCL